MMNEVALSNSLTVNEKVLHSAFKSDFILSRYGKEVNIPLFPKLVVDGPTCHDRKINRTIPAPGGSERTKNSVMLGRKIIKVAPELASKAPVLAST